MTSTQAFEKARELAQIAFNIPVLIGTELESLVVQVQVRVVMCSNKLMKAVYIQEI